MISWMGISIATIVGIAGSALVLLVVVIMLLCLCVFHYKRQNNNSDTASSDPSAAAERRRGGVGGPSPMPRRFTMKELENATKRFDESNLIGIGSFGLVFKGILCDGTVVAIKQCPGAPRAKFSEEVARLSMVQHRNLVDLLGCCQESGYQLLAFEYVPNGSVSSHLYERGSDYSSTKLEFKQRISIATAAAKGLWHLHRQQPAIIHGNFKTSNVLVDENFNAKVADAGLSKLIQNMDDAGPFQASSSSRLANVFRDPEVDECNVYCEASDVYSFGVFLWELITGKEASLIEGLGSNDSMLQWVEKHIKEEDLVDEGLKGRFTAEGISDLIRLALRCTAFPASGGERPAMETVSFELERILDKEIMRTTVVGEGPATVTLGSQLFTN